MSVIFTWIMSGIVHLAVGFAVGWLMVKQPERVRKIYAWIWSWFKTPVG